FSRMSPSIPRYERLLSQTAGRRPLIWRKAPLRGSRPDLMAINAGYALSADTQNHVERACLGRAEGPPLHVLSGGAAFPRRRQARHLCAMARRAARGGDALALYPRAVLQ